MDNSKEIFGPHIISFGNLMSRIADADYFYSLSRSERRLLDKFALSLDRKKYRVCLEEIRFNKTETWAEMTRMAVPHVSRAFRALQDLKILHAEEVGRRKHYRFHDSFIQLMYGQFVLVERQKDDRKSKTVTKPGNKQTPSHGAEEGPSHACQFVKSGDKIDDSYQTGQQTVTKPGNKQLPNRVTNSYQTGQHALYIEELPPKNSLLPPLLVEVPPDPQAVENVDNSRPDTDPVGSILNGMIIPVLQDTRSPAKGIDAEQYEEAKLSLQKIIDKHGLEKTEEFGRYLSAYKVGNGRFRIAIKEIPRILMRFETGETVEQLKEKLGQRRPELVHH